MNVYKEYLTMFYIVIFFTAAPCAAGNNINLMSNETNTPMNSLSGNFNKVDDSPSSLFTYDSCFTGYFTSLSSLFGNLTKKNNSFSVSADECFGDNAAITIGKYGDNVTWSFVPLFDASGFNPVDAIKNFQVMWQYRF
jgi:hypothetical protein